MSKRYALLIGINNYKDQRFDQLLSPESEAEQFGVLLKNYGNFDVKIPALKDSRNLEKEIAEFYKDKKHGDTLLFYFSGHGAMDDDDFYFITEDTDIDEVYRNSMSEHMIKKIMDKSNSQIQIVILDCCRSGGFAKGGEENLASAISQNLEVAKELESSIGRFILASSLKRQKSFEDKDKKIFDEHKSFFTAALIEGIETGGADTSRSGKITVEELFDYAILNIKTEMQKPFKSVKAQGSVELLHNPQTKKTGELHFWSTQELKDRKTCEFLITAAKDLMDSGKMTKAIEELQTARKICRESLHDRDLNKLIVDLIHNVEKGSDFEQSTKKKSISPPETFSFSHTKELDSSDEFGECYSWSIFLMENDKAKKERIDSIEYHIPETYSRYSRKNRDASNNYVFNGQGRKSFWMKILIYLKDGQRIETKHYLDIAYKSAQEILDKNPKTKSGIYWIQPSGMNERIKVNCDMERDGGGWIQVANFRFLPGPHAVPGWNSRDRVGNSYIDDDQDWKMSDNLINTLAQTVYRVDGEHDQGIYKKGYGKITRYWSGKAIYDSSIPSRDLSRISYYDWELKNPTGLDSADGWHYGLTSIGSEEAGYRKGEFVTSHNKDSCVVGCLDPNDHSYSLRIGEKAGFKIWVK